MRILVLAVGKLKDRGLRALVDDYAKRISHHARWEEHELKDGTDPEVTARFHSRIPDRAHVVALEVLGKPLTSLQLSKHIESVQMQGWESMALCIGGSHGLPKAITEQAHLQLSLSNMTLPHRLARLVLAEQIYRAYTILKGQPYDH